MLAQGTRIQSEGQRQLSVRELLGAGGQGSVYSVDELDRGLTGVLKVFDTRFDRDRTLSRSRSLVSLRLAELSPLFAYTAIDVVSASRLTAHFARRAPGRTLEEFLQAPTGSLEAHLRLASTVSQAVALLHERGIVHGDIQARNFLVDDQVSEPAVAAIDLDNFGLDGVPPPDCVGQEMYLSPELREAFENGRPTLLSAGGDLFALAVLLHEILLLRHPAAGFDGAQETFRNAMLSGAWLQDPARRSADPENPARLLNPALAGLFRRALGRDSQERPAAREWIAALEGALLALTPCPGCGQPLLLDSSRTHCPYEGTPFPVMRLRLPDGRQIALNRGAVVVGRRDLGGAPEISEVHAVFRRLGPETRVESLGRNGTYRWARTEWVALPSRRPVLLRSGDWLAFSDVLVQVEQS